MASSAGYSAQNDLDRSIDNESIYFSCYAEVQPVLDNDDPSVNGNKMGESTLDSDAVAQLLQRHAENISEQEWLE